MRHRIVSPVTCVGQDECDIILAIAGCWKYLDPHHAMHKLGHENSKEHSLYEGGGSK
jgi:hypothetical protein